MNSTMAGEYAYMHGVSAPKISLVERDSLFASFSDATLALAAPVVMYWLQSGFFHFIDTFELAERYRIHPAEEIAKRNRATRLQVVREVVFQHVMQTVVGLVFMKFEGAPKTGFEQNEMWHWRQQAPGFVPDVAVYYAYMYGASCIKLFLGFLFIDTWQYFWHRIMHIFPFMYKYFHSVHHELYVPYAFGALFNNPVEGFILDTLGTAIAMVLCGLTHREEAILFTFATMKTIDDHCGYALPFDPFQIIFPNNAVYHDIHHQQFGLKTNFAQPFFTFWDNVFGTNFKGFEEYQKKQRRVTIDKYKEFLAKREAEKAEKIKNFKDENKKEK